MLGKFLFQMAPINQKQTIVITVLLQLTLRLVRYRASAETIRLRTRDRRTALARFMRRLSGRKKIGPET